MFLSAPENPTRLKKAAYLLTAAILGILLSFIVHATIEIGYLTWAESQNLAVPFYGGCALPYTLQIALFAFGAAGGLLLGRFWWRKIYR